MNLEIIVLFTIFYMYINKLPHNNYISPIIYFILFVIVYKISKLNTTETFKSCQSFIFNVKNTKYKNVDKYKKDKYNSTKFSQ